MPAAPQPRSPGPRAARRSALSSAAGVIEDELRRSPVDEPFARMLAIYSEGGRHALMALCDAIESSEEPGEAPALALVEAVCYDDAAERGLRSATWVMAAQRIGETWPASWAEVLAVAREAMPLDAMRYERFEQLAMLSHDARLTADASDREGMHFQFCRESLETIIGATTGRRPARRDMLHVISPWQSCLVAGIQRCEGRLRELGLDALPDDA